MQTQILNRLVEVGINIPANARPDARGEVAMTCPVCSKERRKSSARCLSVNIRKGVWCCHHCGWKPQPDSRANRRRQPAVTRRTAKPDAPVSKVPRRRISPLNSAWRRWLCDRGLDPDLAEAMGVGRTRVFMPQIGGTADVLTFEYRQSGRVLNRKFRTLGKDFRLEKGCQRIFFNADAIGPVTVIVEGELDAVAIAQCGWVNVVSVPDGAPPGQATNLAAKLSFLDQHARDLHGVHRFIIATDNDAPGRRLMAGLGKKLGIRRCRALIWPPGIKDANDALQRLGVCRMRALIMGAARRKSRSWIGMNSAWSGQVRRRKVNENKRQSVIEARHQNQLFPRHYTDCIIAAKQRTSAGAAALLRPWAWVYCTTTPPRSDGQVGPAMARPPPSISYGPLLSVPQAA